ncbi:transporter family-2 protein [Pasteurella langaaensis DSM 22999]|uniref:Transporter family-2 protein n=1 Tax=Alitibacter langaaensis DSM 22999 TaxID=1122935 RepID=A0A2U0T870_9PAST|nr:DMT family transporter [Pasteurella langaaensis]PVX39805.1 transporter family-2 protein [Pasteurella langaaensis DSM 22999]
MTWLMVILAVLGGAMLSVQSAVNGKLGSQVGVFYTAFLTFFLGTLLTGLSIIFFEHSREMGLMNVPKWQLMGAFFGVPYLLAMVLAVKRIGTTTGTVAVIFGQILMSLLIDNFGLFGNQSLSFSPTRLMAAVSLAIALYFIYISNKTALKANNAN